MKRLLFALLGILIFSPAHSATKDSLQKELLYQIYTDNFHAEHEKGESFSAALFNAASHTFSGNARIDAIWDANVNDQEISELINTTISRFLHEKFMAIACHDYDKKIEPILSIYAAPQCDYITRQLSAAGKVRIADDNLQEIITEASISQARSEAFKVKAAQMRDEYGQDLILHALNCMSEYMYVACASMRNRLVSDCTESILKKRTANKRLLEQQFYHAFDTAVISGNYQPLKQYHASDSKFSKTKKKLAKLRSQLVAYGKRVITVHEYKDGQYRITYSTKENQQNILGALQVKANWIEHSRMVSSVKYVPPKKVKQ